MKSALLPDPEAPGHRTEASEIPPEVHIGQPEGGLVLFAHGSDSNRLSPRNRDVARRLHGFRLGTLLFDLLQSHEAHDRRCVFDIDLLGEWLVQAIDRVGRQAALATLRVGLLGAGTATAAALVAAARRPAVVAAFVSRGGGPDLAADWLAAVQAPTLLIVGGADTEVLALNRAAAQPLPCPHRIEVLADATHLFAEPGALEHVATLAAAWFGAHHGTADGSAAPAAT